MSYILVVEPDTAQAEMLQTIVTERVGAEMNIVSSAAAAMMAVSRHVPDLLLFGRNVSSLDEIVIADYARSLSPSAAVLALTIPELKTVDDPAPPRSGWFRLGKSAAHRPTGWDPILFAEQIASTLARADAVVGAVNSQAPTSDSESPEPNVPDPVPEAQDSGLADTESELEKARARADAAEERVRELVRIQQEAEAARLASEDSARALQREVARVRADAEARLESELARVRREADQKTRVDADDATRALRIEIARVRAEAQARLEQELVRVRQEAERARLLESHAQREAEAQREAAAVEARSAAEEAARVLQLEVARTKAETEARFEEELRRVRNEADQARHANQEARLEMQLLREQAARAEEARDRPLVEHHGPTPWTEGRGDSAERFFAYRGAPAAPARARRHGGLFAAAAMMVLAVAGSLAFYLPRVRPAAPTEPIATSTRAPERSVRPSTRGDARLSARRAVLDPQPAVAAPGNQTSGFLSVFSRIPLELYLGDRPLGSSDGGQMMLPPGRHRIRIANEHFKFHGELELDVRPGDLTSHTVVLPTATVHVETIAGAEVRIEGEHVGVAPIGEVQVPIGTREVVVIHPQMGERRQAVEVIYGQTTSVTVGFSQEPVSAGPPRLAPLSAPL